jgi:ribosomal protein S18 acetylase RimI-like enzyme
MVLELNYKFRPFKPADLEDVIQINRDCLPENYTPLFFMNLYKRYPQAFIVAEISKKIVGYIMCRIETGAPSFRLMGVTKKGHVISIAVLPEHQQKGLGYSLMLEATQAMVDYKQHARGRTLQEVGIRNCADAQKLLRGRRKRISHVKETAHFCEVNKILSPFSAPFIH